MTCRLLRCLLVALPALASTTAVAGPDAFGPGTLIEQFGAVADVDGAAPIPKDATFRIAFDISEPAEEGKVSRRLETAARFLNMHAAAGVPPERMSLALVVHGKAAFDLVTDERRGQPNPNAPLIAALVDAGVTIELCGQTAAYYDIAVDDLLDGVQMSLSAMTSHALLQQRGYTLNPF